jgi:uridine kinase
MSKTIIIGIAGGSGSGKTTFARKLYELLGNENCAIIGQDSYYIDQSSKFDQDGGTVNFDHPNAIDFDLLEEHLIKLKNNSGIEVPIYDFATHKRKDETIKVSPHSIILVDGILILGIEHVRRHFDESVFIDVPEDVRFERRLKRDVEERGRTALGVFNQFHKQVKPMHDEFVAPSMQYATLVVTTQSFVKDLNKFADHLRSKLSSFSS